MGRKGSWFSALKKSLTLDPKENKDQKTHKSKKWFGKYKNEDAVSSCEETALVIPAPAPAPAPASTPTLLPPPTPPPKEDVELAEAEKAQNKHAYSVALATAVAAEAAVAAVQAAAEVVRLTAVPMPRYTGKSMQEAAAIKIQTAFRGHLMGEDWNDSTESKEQVEAKLQMKQEAAVRRERALAYSFSHQKMWKNSPKYDHPTIMDPSNPHWGWSWLERWMAARPWESRSTAGFNDRASMRSAASRASMSVGEITKAYALRDKPFPRTPTALRSSRPSSRQSPSTPRSTAPLSASITRRTLRGNGRGGDEDSRSTLSIQSERFNRRFSMAGFSVRDHEGLASSPSVQSYRTPTKPTKARSRLATLNSNQPEKNGTPSEKGSVTSVKKQLSFAASPAGPRRHSGPLMYDSSSIKGTLVHARKCSR
ncbi:protein IQ-DOMAIN 3-like isoform X3 [Malus sylvestris]|uniref:protein IQ-DOMAIN 3-like isoform X3 n=1 Tax=Malus sylvestris TaxID=3752 RepID=UPI0021AD2968|nr:protein IQ-DOMAIN 3-like isoform X3 [Malus sylvestris]